MKGTIILIISAVLAAISVRLTGHSRRRFVQPVVKIADSDEVVGDYVEVPKS